MTVLWLHSALADWLACDHAGAIAVRAGCPSCGALSVELVRERGDKASSPWFSPARVLRLCELAGGELGGDASALKQWWRLSAEARVALLVLTERPIAIAPFVSQFGSRALIELVMRALVDVDDQGGGGIVRLAPPASDRRLRVVPKAGP